MGNNQSSSKIQKTRFCLYDSKYNHQMPHISKNHFSKTNSLAQKKTSFSLSSKKNKIVINKKNNMNKSASGFNSKQNLSMLNNSLDSYNKFHQFQQKITKISRQQRNITNRNNLYDKKYKTNNNILNKKKLDYNVSTHFQSSFHDTLFAQNHQQKAFLSIFPLILNSQNNTHQFRLSLIQNACYDSLFPLKRYGACLIQVRGIIYMIGGAIRRRIHNYPIMHSSKDILFHQYLKTGSWKQVLPINFRSSNQKKNFFGHSVNKVLSNYIVIAGGVDGDSINTLNMFYNSIDIYDTNNQIYYQYSWEVKVREHSSASTQKQVFIHGGINEQKKIKNNLYRIIFRQEGNNFSNKNLINKIIKYSTNLRLAHHAMVHIEVKGKNIYQTKVRQLEGLIIFGGEDPEGNADNKLKHLKLSKMDQNQRKLYRQFEEVIIEGQAPQARSRHSMNSINNSNQIVIIGGIDISGKTLKDIWLADLISRQWLYIVVPSFSEQIGGINHHATTVSECGTKIYIFGGNCEKDKGSHNFWKLQLVPYWEKQGNKGDNYSSFGIKKKILEYSYFDLGTAQTFRYARQTSKML